MYPTDCDLRCRYSFKTAFVHPNPGDRIAIFKVGWKHVTEYYLFKMVKVPAEEHVLACQRICFSAPVLPKNVKDLYQLCYLTHDNLVLGASSPFSFYNASAQELVCVEDKACQEVMIYKSRLSVLHDGRRHSGNSN
ncbi:calcium-binding and coiled-coil domain-containing protein 2-like [Nilaparvata lugens]|uniref:calcium-binding and coiled-coil domain-containing protein 2-like n=1 Tax=Nilaparvata lugens TaxID=108931 RepID=UPI00193D9747|nr:calcium-binding and coiled-coil domain-containing protein 2-like [Nilaparvata lugens]